MPPRTSQRFRSIRTALLLLALVPSLALAGLWAVTTSRDLSNAYNLRDQMNTDQAVAKAFGDTIQAAAKERTLSAIWLADRKASHAALNAIRPKLDVGVSEMKTDVPAALKDAPQKSKTAFQPVVDAVRGLNLIQLRQRIDQRTIDIRTATSAFTRVINAEIVGTAFAFQVDDASLVIDSLPVQTLIDAREQMEQEDAILAPAVARGRIGVQDRAAFVRAVGARRWLMARVNNQLDQTGLDQVEKMVTSASWKTVEAIEDSVLAQPGNSTTLPASAAEWPSAMAQADAQMQTVTIVDNILKFISVSHHRAESVIRQAWIISGAGLVAIIVSALLSWRVTRSLLRRLAGLRRDTLELAERRLPDLVERLNRGENVDIESEAVDITYGTDELGAVASALNSAQHTALTSAVALADARRGFQKAILAVARHTQNLVNRQLSLLDTMEREHQDPEVLQGLYELDSQASQMRRYEENLVIISGGQPGRRWTKPVALVDVLRSAVGEVADYQRITVHADERLKLAAYAVADVIHLLAELMENATNFSPPICPVWVRSEYVGKGLAIEIEDRGLGMSEEEFEQANQRLSRPPQFDVLALADDARLGLFVVARLAAQHGIRVTLRPSPFGGTSAVILIPTELVVQDPFTEIPGRGGRAVPALDPAAQPGPGEPSRTPALASVASLNQAGPPPEQGPSDWGAPEWDVDEQEVPEWGVPEQRQAPERQAPERQAPERSAPAAGGAGRGKHGGSVFEPAGLPPLPQRVPQASLAEELRRDPPLDTPQAEPQSMPAPEQVARTMSAFQRGSAHARDFRAARQSSDRNSVEPAKDPR